MSFRVIDEQKIRKIVFKSFKKTAQTNQKEGFTLRQAREDDCRDLWMWRNHPDVRKWCFNKEEISYDQHKIWFEEILKNGETIILIIQGNGEEKLGQVRFDVNLEKALININLNPQFFNRGIGASAIRMATKVFLYSYPLVDEIVAEIFKNNIVSQKAFQKADYSKVGRQVKNNEEIEIFSFKRREITAAAAGRNQTEIFMKKEGNAWFQRNKKALFDPQILSRDHVLRLIKTSNIIPKKVLEVGCSNGWRLGEIERRYGCRCMGIDASRQAIADGKKRYPKVVFKRGNIASLPLKNECFDLVIVHFVFHWVARDLLLKAVSEIDRVVVDNGFLIVGDFLPDKPLKNSYHHLPEERVYTYKLDYANIFVSSGRYKITTKAIFDHDKKTTSGKISPYNRAGCFVLRKSIDDFYKIQPPINPRGFS